MTTITSFAARAAQPLNHNEVCGPCAPTGGYTHPTCEHPFCECDGCHSSMDDPSAS